MSDQVCCVLRREHTCSVLPQEVPQVQAATHHHKAPVLVVQGVVHDHDGSLVHAGLPEPILLSTCLHMQRSHPHMAPMDMQGHMH